MITGESLSYVYSAIHASGIDFGWQMYRVSLSGPLYYKL